MIFSLLVAFIVTPWAALRLLKREQEPASEPEARAAREDWTMRLYRRVMKPLVSNRRWRLAFFALVVVLFLRRLLARAVQARDGQDAALRQQERVPGHH